MKKLLIILVLLISGIGLLMGAKRPPYYPPTYNQQKIDNSQRLAFNVWTVVTWPQGPFICTVEGDYFFIATVEILQPYNVDFVFSQGLAIALNGDFGRKFTLKNHVLRGESISTHRLVHLVPGDVVELYAYSDSAQDDKLPNIEIDSWMEGFKVK